MASEDLGDLDAEGIASSTYTYIRDYATIVNGRPELTTVLMFYSDFKNYLSWKNDNTCNIQIACTMGVYTVHTYITIDR